MPRNFQALIITFFAVCFCVNAVLNMAFYTNKSVPKIENLQNKIKVFKDSAYSVHKKTSMQALLDSAKKCDTEIEVLQKTSKNRFLDKFWFRAIIMVFFSYWATVAVIKEWQSILELRKYKLPFTLENWQKLCLVVLVVLIFLFFE